jgi:ornithine decarboxylase
MCSRIISFAKRKGIDLSILDIGGGIPIRYVGDVYSFEDLSALLNKELEEHIPKDVQVIMEPGRPMVGSSMTLLTTVIGTSKRGAWHCLYLDDGVYNSLSERVFGHCQYRIVSDKKGKLRKYKIFGPTCDSMDVIAKGSYLQEQKEGDLLLVLNAGAYTNSAATHFNGFDPAKIVFV